MGKNNRRVEERTGPVELAFLCVGYVALVGALYSAFSAPATGYELSIYTHTPIAFWIGIGVALCVALVTAYRVSGYPALGAVLLSNVAVLGVVALPMIRGYHFYGAGDSLTHLGWAKMIESGGMSPADLLYPALHTMAVVVSDTVGISLAQAMNLVPLAFVVVYFIFVPLCVRAIAGDQHAVVVGIGSGLLLLPINNVSTFLMPYPTVQALFLVPVVVYLLFRYMAGRETWSTGALLALTAAAIVVVHPQQALNVLLVFAVISVLQFAVRRIRPGHPISNHPLLVGQTAFVAGAFLLWTLSHERVFLVTDAVVSGLLGAGVPGGEVAQRSESLAALGTSVGELFVKLFLVATVYFALSALVVYRTVFREGRAWFSDRPGFVVYLGFGMVPIVGVFVVFLVANVTVQPFRYLGFVALFATVLGAVALARLGSGLGDGRYRRVARIATIALVGVFLVAQLAVIHPSPYMYQASAGVSDGEMSGYETTFEYRDADAGFTGIRTGPNRFVDAHYGTGSEIAGSFPGKTVSIPPSVFGHNVSSYYPDDRYIPVTDRAYQREVELYDGLRYGGEGFESLDRTPEIDRVEANGEYTLYVLESE